MALRHILGPLMLCLAAAAGEPDFQRQVLPVLTEFCADCHLDGMSRGGIALDTYRSKKERLADATTWLAVARNLEAHLMPPARKPQPSPSQRTLITQWIESEVLQLDPQHPDPGRVTVRRLNRDEYHNTILDLLGVDYDVAEFFPADDTGFGFDTVGDALNLSPLHVEKYLDAAQVIAARAAQGNDGRPPLLSGLPEGAKAQEAFVRQRLRELADRAFRRPVDQVTLDKLTALATSTPQIETGFVRALAAVLSSPRFLFRTEFQPRPDDPQKVVPLDDWALASRLSYFLWCSLPDEELRNLARTGQLRPHLHEQVDRLIADPKSRRFVRSFVGQWLRTRDVETLHIDAERILGAASIEDALRVFGPEVRAAMRQETELMFEHLLRQDRNITELLLADYTFLNEPLARFYGIPGISHADMRRVELPAGSHRHGLLTHASVLVVTSNPTRTSPVKRGLFVLDNLLGTPPPPPPVNVPPLEAAAKDGQKPATVRELMALHRQDPLCNSCHSRMDPLGLALEHYSALGQYRETELGALIDTSGTLSTGESFSSAEDLSRILATQRRPDFYRCLSEKLLTAALGRGPEPFDRPLLRDLVRSLETNHGRLRALIHKLVDSPAFQQRRGHGNRLHTLRASPPAPALVDIASTPPPATP